MHGLCKTLGRKLIYSYSLETTTMNIFLGIFLDFLSVFRHTHNVFTEVGSFYIKFRGLSFAEHYVTNIFPMSIKMDLSFIQPILTKCLPHV